MEILLAHLVEILGGAALVLVAAWYKTIRDYLQKKTSIETEEALREELLLALSYGKEKVIEKYKSTVSDIEDRVQSQVEYKKEVIDDALEYVKNQNIELVKKLNLADEKIKMKIEAIFSRWGV